MVVGRGSKIDTLNTTIGYKSMIGTTTKSDTKLWHTRLGHMGEKGMKILASRGKLLKLKSIDMEFYESCVFWKHNKVSFTKIKMVLKDKKLELVQTHVWGRSPINSLGGSRYFVTFIDDFSWKV